MQFATHSDSRGLFSFSHCGKAFGAEVVRQQTSGAPFSGQTLVSVHQPGPSHISSDSVAWTLKRDHVQSIALATVTFVEFVGRPGGCM